MVRAAINALRMPSAYQLAPRGTTRVSVVASGLPRVALDSYLSAAIAADAAVSQTLNEDLTSLRAGYVGRKSLSFYPYSLPYCSELLTCLVTAVKEQARLLWTNAFPEEFAAHTVQGLKYIPGGSFTPHADDRINVKIGTLAGADVRKWVVNAPNRQIVGILYLNDDYEGGELYFLKIKGPDGKQLSIKPKRGQIAVFGGDDRYLHGVTEVTKGERYAVTLWFAPLPLAPTETVAEHRARFEAANPVPAAA